MDCFNTCNSLSQAENMTFPKFTNVFENIVQNNCVAPVPTNPLSLWHPPDPHMYYGLFRYPG